MSEHGCARHGEGKGEECVSDLEADVRLDDGHEVLRLADERVAREVAHVRLDHEVARLLRRHVNLERAG